MTTGIDRMKYMDDDEVRRLRTVSEARAVLDLKAGRVGGSRACYAPEYDRVRVPALERFEVPDQYYQTLFHELTHSTGHESRLKRPGIVDLAAFGSTEYAREELVAEMGAAFLCGEAGIVQDTIDNSAAYISNWLKRLKDDVRLVVTAAAQAQKAADFVLDRKYDAE